MKIYYDARKARGIAIMMLATFAAGIALFAWLLTLDLDGVARSALRGGAVGVIMVGAVQSWVFFGMAARKTPIVTIDDSGVAFHLKNFPSFPWDRIEVAEVSKIIGADQFAVSVKEPAPRLGVLVALRQAVTRRRKNGLMRYAVPVARLAATRDEIEAGLAQHRPAAQ